MTDTMVAKRYAKSFLTLSQERNSLEVSHRDMSAFISACSENRDFQLMLKNPLIQPDKKNNILKKMFDSRFDKLTMAFLDIIVKKRREFYLESIAEEFESQYRAVKGITTAELISAGEINEFLRNEIKSIVKIISKNEVSLTESIDKDLIGGFILRFKYIQFDASISRNLNQFRMNFNKNLYQSKLWKN